jgi:hypothetical protein
MSNNFENNFKNYLTNIVSKYNDNILNYFNIKLKCSNILIKKIDDLYILCINKISDNLLHSDDMINKILHNINYCIFNKDITFYYINLKKNIITKPYDLNIINEFKKNWDNISVYENIGLNTIFFNYNNIIYFYDIYDNTIIPINTINYINNYFNKLNLNITDKTIVNVNIILTKYTHLLYYKNNDIIDNIVINKNENIYFSCFDEFIFDLENISKQNETKKKITTNGYIIKYNNTEYIFNTYIYQKINDLMINVRNINKTYLELYKNDNLKFVINYMSPYPQEIIKRVNMSIKTLSRELLNIYHITRKKLNPDLYNILSNNYRTILFDLHKIFIYARKKENECENSDDFFTIKQSMTHEIIYKYLKKININLLTYIYIDRLQLLNDIQNVKIDVDNMKLDTNEFKVLFNDCINTKTMSVLLLKN